MMQSHVYEDLDNIGRVYSLEENIHMYTKSEVVKRLVTNTKTGFLPPGEVFCLHCKRHMREAMDMFHALYYVKDFMTFIQTACWMRVRINEGMFVYALTVAVWHSEHTKGIVLPSPFEIYPYLFVHSDVLNNAYLIKMKGELPDKQYCELHGIQSIEKDVYTIDENISDQRGDLNTESMLRYFTEDIGLNTYYYYLHVDFPFWMNSKMSKARQGELTYYAHQQLLARYNLERLSHNMCNVKPLSLYHPLRTGFWPNMKLHNGIEMPMRYNNYPILHDDNLDLMGLIDNFEKMLREAISKGFITMQGDTNITLKKQEDLENLARLVYGNLDDFHGDIINWNLPDMIKSLFGFSAHEKRYFMLTTALDQYQTTIRDPVFWKIHERIMEFFVLFKMNLPSYSGSELHFAGVKVERIVFDKMVTYFDDFFMDMTNVVPLSREEVTKNKSDVTVIVRKCRLNHYPFTITVDVVSDKITDSVIRIFLGPKMDCMGRALNIEENRLNFVEIDTFMQRLTNGKNVITRKSSDMNNLVRDRLMTQDWMSRVTSAEFEEMMATDMKNIHTGFPMRLLLPIGRVGGMAVTVLVVISPLKRVGATDKPLFSYIDHNMGSRYSVKFDEMPLGFPLDRRIDATLFPTANMKFSEVMIFHKNVGCDKKLRWEQHILKGYNLQP